MHVQAKFIEVRKAFDAGHSKPPFNARLVKLFAQHVGPELLPKKVGAQTIYGGIFVDAKKNGLLDGVQTPDGLNAISVSTSASVGASFYLPLVIDPRKGDAFIGFNENPNGKLHLFGPIKPTATSRLTGDFTPQQAKELGLQIFKGTRKAAG